MVSLPQNTLQLPVYTCHRSPRQAIGEAVDKYLYCESRTAEYCPQS